MTEFEIFKSCFPQLPIDEKAFSRLAFSEDTEVFHTEGGFACTEGSRITLLCVAPQRQRNGEGTRLLKLCEEHIKQNGSAVITLSGSMLPGTTADSRSFFKKQGYTIDSEFMEMELRLSNFTIPDYKTPSNAQYGFFDGSIDELRRAVAEVDGEWVQYFNEDGLFFCCFVNGDIASFCIIGEDEDCLLSDGSTKTGSIGCVGTVPKFRRKGLGLHMVALSAQWLKKQGCDNVFIHYTHLEDWYGKLGAKTFLRFSPAEKRL
ncbi:MAG: GNAT family N-acetyltransferase [Oscillospiraceae bacterium]|nr:GNAT family N-acetyltransferase [Oscillospiraceae bacterium]